MIGVQFAATALVVVLAGVLGEKRGWVEAGLVSSSPRRRAFRSLFTGFGATAFAALPDIAFTMSLFIATLAFDGTTLLDSAKVGILGGSIVSGVVGAMVVRRGTRSARPAL